MVTPVLNYFFTELETRFPGGWLGAPRPLEIENATGKIAEKLEALGISVSARYRERLQNVDTFTQLLERFSLKSIRLDSQMGLWGWSSGRYPLSLRHDIPSPEEMLEVQCRGERLVTWLIRPEERDTPIGRHKGAFEFLLHDLEHAHKFFGDPFTFRGQTGFFKFLKGILPRFDHLQSDPLFVKDLDYLKSDMNSHPLHLFKYLKAIVLSAYLRKSRSATADMNEFWMEVLEDWPRKTLAAALRINHPGLERPEDTGHVSGIFSEL
jgi:hypothetical protein